MDRRLRQGSLTGGAVGSVRNAKGVDVKWTLSYRPSPAMVVALLALLLAASGTAIAATNLVNGDKLIKKGSLSGNRLRNHSVTGGQINLSRLGTVPQASHAATAETATNAESLGGSPPSAYLSASGTATDSAELGGMTPDTFATGHANVTTVNVSVLDNSTQTQLFTDSALAITASVASPGAAPMITVVNNTAGQLRITTTPGGITPPGTATDGYIASDGGTVDVTGTNGGIIQMQVFGSGSGSKAWTITISEFPGSPSTFVAQTVTGTAN
jgi:hypothetical protein